MTETSRASIRPDSHRPAVLVTHHKVSDSMSKKRKERIISKPLWQPSKERIGNTNMHRFTQYVNKRFIKISAPMTISISGL